MKELCNGMTQCLNWNKMIQLNQLLWLRSSKSIKIFNPRCIISFPLFLFFLKKNQHRFSRRGEVKRCLKLFVCVCVQADVRGQRVHRGQRVCACRGRSGHEGGSGCGSLISETPSGKFQVAPASLFLLQSHPSSTQLPVHRYWRPSTANNDGWEGQRMKNWSRDGFHHFKIWRNDLLLIHT